MLMNAITGVKSRPLFDVPRLAEYERGRRRCGRCALDSFVPSEGLDGMDAGSLMKMFFMNPLQGVFRK